jgi:RimJ/RimL family protein N-acetyltransferase
VLENACIEGGADRMEIHDDDAPERGAPTMNERDSRRVPRTLTVRPVATIAASARAPFLAAMPEPQELYVERRFAKAEKRLLLDARSGAEIGYAAIDEGTLVEHWLTDSADAGAMIEAIGARRALCPSFDAARLAVLTPHFVQARVVGYLFRALDRAALSSSQALAAHGLTARLARSADAKAILAMHEGFFDDADEVAQYTDDEGLMLFFDVDDALIGCGVRRRVVAGAPGVDIGMVVAPAMRGRGVGAAIVREMARRCLAAGDRPICGCDVDNLASRRALARAGFVGAHPLIELARP